MKLLVYKWGSVSESLFCKVLKELHINYVEFAKELKNYHYDAEFAQEFIYLIHREKVSAVFSYDYFPMIAMLCEINKIPYMSWIYDCPMRTLQSKTLTSEYNYIFCFDRKYTVYLNDMGAVHCIHYPLAGNVGMLQGAMTRTDNLSEKYGCNVSFIGNLYNGMNNRFRKVLFSEEASVWIENLLQAQTMNYSENILKSNLLQRDDMLAEIVEKCELTLGAEYIQDNAQFAADVLGMEVSARERELVLKAISACYPIRLYTASELPEGLHNKNLDIMGYANYDVDLPLIYHNSRINLNMTSRTIETGIPQRIFDILACGGFCLTNYQEEIAEFFEDGRELVMFHDQDDLLEKLNYYLEHEEERKEIARSGRDKVARCFGLKDRIKAMLDYVK